MGIFSSWWVLTTETSGSEIGTSIQRMNHTDWFTHDWRHAVCNELTEAVLYPRHSGIYLYVTILPSLQSALSDLTSKNSEQSAADLSTSSLPSTPRDSRYFIILSLFPPPQLPMPDQVPHEETTFSLSFLSKNIKFPWYSLTTRLIYKAQRTNSRSGGFPWSTKAGYQDSEANIRKEQNNLWSKCTSENFHSRLFHNTTVGDEALITLGGSVSKTPPGGGGGWGLANTCCPKVMCCIPPIPNGSRSF